MLSLVKIVRCPYCNVPMDKALLKRHGLLKAFLQREAFPCPHCQKAIQLPESAEKLTSIGLFVAVILAPLFHYWQLVPIPALYVFGIGLALLLFGLWSQKLVKAPSHH
ncbi:hypothetical protein [Halioxenophilus aromaticivorans]|uniref:Cxxc_20_cxxc protein n=1 Tax=Halioxenophilus aromaticivorans TaxID=1306992 RepID=A0AAV3TZH0_9ALTE